MNKGFIYKITNKTNGKVYIGQTIKIVNLRFRQHINDSKRNDFRSNYPLYKAIRKYGSDNFYVETIEELQNFIQKEIDERETYWIKYYNSTNSIYGYNQMLGGKTTPHLDLDENKVIELYNKLRTISSVANIFNCSASTISSILAKNKIKIISPIEHCKSKSKDIFQYDYDYNLVNKFKSFNEAGDWLIENNISNAKNNIYAANSIKSALKNNSHFVFGYYWICIPDFTDEEKENFINKNKKDKKKYYMQCKVNPTERNICSLCGNWKTEQSEFCKCCTDKIKRENTSFLETKYNINKEALKQEIRNYTFVELSKKYGVSDNAIRKWCKRYNLPFKSSEIKKYSDEEWEKI